MSTKYGIINITPVITHIEKRDASTCYYYGKGNANLAVTFVSGSFKFTDSLGKFQVGDNVKLSKK